MGIYESKFQTEDVIEHGKFGKGVVKKVDLKEKTALLTVDFNVCVGRKILSEVWVLEHCKCYLESEQI